MNLEPILWMESDRLGFPSLRDASLERVKESIKKDRLHREVSPHAGSNDASWRAIFPSTHPYQSSTLGEQSTIDKLTLRQANEFFKKYYDPVNATLVLAGDFDLQEAKKLIVKYFETIPSDKRPSVPFDGKPARIDKEIVLEHTEQVGSHPHRMLMRWLTPPLCSDDDVVADVLANILLRGRSGRLAALHQQDRHSALNLSVHQLSLQLQSVFTIVVGGQSRAELLNAKDFIDKQLADLAQNGVPEQELKTAKLWQRMEQTELLESLTSKAHWLLRADQCFKSPHATGRIFDQIAKVSSADVQRVAQSLIPQKRVIAYSQPIDAGKESAR